VSSSPSVAISLLGLLACSSLVAQATRDPRRPLAGVVQMQVRVETDFPAGQGNAPIDLRDITEYHLRRFGIRVAPEATAQLVIQARATPGLRGSGATVSTVLELIALVQPADDSTAPPRRETLWRRARTATEVATQDAPSYNEVQGAVRTGLLELLRQFTGDWQRANPAVDPGSRPGDALQPPGRR
jgi:hypothetical protein